jgi:hypothetical protein
VAELLRLARQLSPQTLCGGHDLLPHDWTE